MADQGYVTRDGSRLTPAMLEDLELMNLSFRQAEKQSLLVTSGIRTRAEQTAIFLQRYVRANEVNGRRVYDYRTWQGVLWARISPAGTVAAPDSPAANHVLENTGAGAVDLRDTGSDAGVTTRGTARANWLRANSHQFNYLPEGYNFNEPWHYKYLGDPWRKVASKPEASYEEVVVMASRGDAFIVGYSGTKGNRGGIHLACLSGKFKKLTAEQWNNAKIKEMLKDLTVINAGNDREFDIIRDLCR